MKQINIVLFFPNHPPHSPYTNEKWKARHDDFISYFPINVQFYLVKDETKYCHDNTFIPNYVRVWSSWVKYTWNEIYADLILWPNKGQKFTNIYHNPIKELCRDKRKIEVLFPKYTLKSYTCESYVDVVKYWESISSKIKVLKPVFGSQWTWVIIWNALPHAEEITESYPYMLQEFIDTSRGFYRHTWIHDFRTILLNGKITWSFLRIAQEWVMTANVNTGARIIDYDIWNIPPEIEKVIWEVDAYLESLYPERYYSIDLWIWKNGEIKIFELNSSPMLSTQSIRKALALHIIKNILKIS